MSITFNTDTVAAILNTDALKQRADDVAVSAVDNKVAGQALAENNRCISANQNMVVAKDSGTIVAYLTFGAASTHPKLVRDSSVIATAILDAVVSNSISESTCDCDVQMYVHESYLDQGIQASLLSNRATYQIANGFTHCIAYKDYIQMPALPSGSTILNEGRFINAVSITETSKHSPAILNWNGTVTGRIDLGVSDEAGQAVYLWPLSSLE